MKLKRAIPKFDSSKAWQVGKIGKKQEVVPPIREVD
ncbi:MAG: hypothetical protein RLZZ474_165 [Bacteroidota bacterium]